ncbi:hypothetical protein B0T11DRAFT_109927 [Plectosphaerella cucumerina]|uniref:Dystroglycan-type cadherin-like domain-containing protein n=1 Tax=Plectosphaerella cucumerina TaxID=40658 RepID=A0A8K0TC74_9PEZI|nr:hypothetical protein B0T11DRAFT_109927 [Plectosphaerella cucumerina]
MPSSLCCIAALAALGLVAASPAVHFPFNSQLPPVARISESFSYTLSPQTFSSPSPIRYSLSGAPDWLSIDEKSGRLHGTPKDDKVPAGDVVGVTVNIIADDGTGSTAMSATLVVSRNSAPTVQIPLADQISNFGDQSAPGAIVSYPASPFAFSFDKKTFSSKAPLNYYATSADSSPLPSWMIFDAANLTFSGQTPPFESLIQPPQTFGFQVVASDIVGFSASSIVFSVVVGSRKLTMDNPVVQLNATRGSNVSYDGLASEIKLDGNRVEPSELTVSTDGFPHWLSIDNNTLGISGNVPRDAQSSNATATFRNGLSDSLSVQLQVLVDTGIFRRPLLEFNATSDEAFELDLEPYLWEPGGVRIDIKTEPDQDWLEIDNLVLSGTPPDSIEEQEEVRLTIKATVEGTGDSETQRATLRLLSSTESTSTTSTTPTPSPTSSDAVTGTQTPSETEPAAATGEFGDGLNGGQIALAVILPILIIATLVAIFILLRRRQEKKFRRIEAGDISGPVPGTFVQNSGPGGNDPSGIAAIKAFHTIPMAEPTYRPGQRGYLRAALRRMRSTRTTSSFDSDSQHSFTLAPPMLSRMRSTSENAASLSRFSWLSEEGHLGLVGRTASSRRHSNNSILSVYDSLRDFPSRRRYLRAQTESSWRSTLDVTIPMMEEDRSSSSLHLNSEAHASERPVTRAGDPEKRPFRRNESLFSVPPVPPPPPPPKLPADPKTPPRSSIPDPQSALGSHPTHGKRFTPDAAAFMVYKDNLDNMDARDSQVTVATASVFGLDGLTREHSRGSELSHIRPVSRRSGASPWFGSRASMASRSTYTRRTHHDFASASSIPSMPALPPSALSPSASEFASSSADQEPNWRTISRNLASSTADLQSVRESVRDRRTSLDLAYQELIRQSPFYPLPPAPPPTAAPPPQPVKSMMRAVSNAQENRYVPMPLAKDKSWMGKGVSLRPRPLRQSDTNASLMSPTKWNFPLPPGKAGERPVSSIRQVRSSAGSRRDLGMGSEYNSARSSRVLPSEDSSGWTTDPASPRHVDRPGSRQRREGTFGTMGEDSPDTRGRRSGSREYPVYI